MNFDGIKKVCFPLSNLGKRLMVYLEHSLLSVESKIFLILKGILHFLGLIEIHQTGIIYVNELQYW